MKNQDIYVCVRACVCVCVYVLVLHSFIFQSMGLGHRVYALNAKLTNLTFLNGYSSKHLSSGKS